MEENDPQIQRAMKQLRMAKHGLVNLESKPPDYSISPRAFPLPAVPSRRGSAKLSSARNGNPEYGDELVDPSALLGDIDETQWLMSTRSAGSKDIEELEADRSFVDTPLLNMQNSLLHEIKGLIYEQKNLKLLRQAEEAAKNEVIPSRALPTPTPRPTPPSLVQRKFPTSKAGSISSDGSVDSEFGILTSSPVSSRFNKRMELVDIFDEDININKPKQRYVFETPPRQIDTRTYTRPKKNRASLDGHILNASSPGFSSLTIRKDGPTMTLPPEVYTRRDNNLNEIYTHGGEGDNACELEPSAEFGSPLASSHGPKGDRSYFNNETANTTFTKAGDRTMMNTTITLGDQIMSSPSRRQVARNESYVIHKSPNYNEVQSQQRDINSTFVCDDKGKLATHSNSADNHHNLSMEELHVLARMQEQSLKDAAPNRTLTRKDTHVLMNFSTYGEKRPTRTSSTDTYSLGQSNPDSPGSSASGLSSPLDAQSYDNLQGEAFRRSMPDLAISRRLSNSSSSGRMSLAPPLNSLKAKPYHHTSDTRLANPANGGRLSVATSGQHFAYSRNRRTSSPDRDHSSTSSIETNSRMMPRNRYSGSGGSQPQGNSSVRPTPSQMSQARYASQLAQPKQQFKPSTFLPPPGFSQFGAAGALRPQSRIPAPGASRFRPSRPTTAGGSRMPSSHLGKQPEWRDGCY